MQLHFFIVYLLAFPCLVINQMSYPQSGQYASPLIGEQQQQQTAPLTNAPLPSNSNENYLVGNLSQPFSFQVAPPSIKVTYLGLNGYSLYITGVGFSNKSKFHYDEQINRLTVLSLDPGTVGYYSAVDANWKTFTNILSAINVSSLQIRNSHVSEDNNGSLISCSVSIIRSTFQLSEPPSQTNNLQPKSMGTENLPRLNLFLSTRTSSVFTDKKVYNDTLNEQNFTRTITLQRPLTRADENGTIQCQVESNNNVDVYLTKTVRVDIEYGPNLETGAPLRVNLESEVLKMISMDCQIEANPTPSYVWYERASNTSDSGQQTSYGQVLSFGQSVFGTTRQIQRVYQYPGHYAMECQAQSRGRTVKQEFFISVFPQTNALKNSANIDQTREKSNRIPVIIGTIIGAILLLLATAIVIATIVYLKRRKMDPNIKHSASTEKISNEAQGKPRWGGLPVDYSKRKHESLKTDSSSTSHLVESAETASIQAPPPVPARPSPMTSTHSSYRQAPGASVSLSYRQASALPGFRSTSPIRSYSPEEDNVDEGSTSINAMPLAVNRSRANTQFGSHKSLSESLHSLRSNQQPSLALPMKKRSQDPPPTMPKREQKSPSPKAFQAKNEYQHHHYHNPAQLRAEQQMKTNNTSSEEEGEIFDQPQITKPLSETSAFIPQKFAFRSTLNPAAGYNQMDYSQQQSSRRIITPPPPQKMVVHQPHDEAPPSYHQVANTSSPSHAYVYHEPTEV